jgi:hypothetical protein
MFLFGSARYMNVTIPVFEFFVKAAGTDCYETVIMSPLERDRLP